MSKINRIHAIQIIDSRGNPTIEVEVTLSNNISSYASCPSGASVGTLEALELRDNNSNLYLGKSVYNAVNNVNNQINSLLKNFDPCDQKLIDSKLIELDGTENKSSLGANAILATSLAVAKSAAKLNELPLYRYIRKIYDHTISEYNLPIPMMNVINGGAHADNDIDLQEFMIMPIGKMSFSKRIQAGVEIFHNLKSIIKSEGHNTNVGDEGGFAPNLSTSNQALNYLKLAIEKSGYVIGDGVAIAIDAAASELYKDGFYHIEKKRFNPIELVNYYKNLTIDYPIYSIEDAMAENDIEGWKLITQNLGHIQLVGDDLIVTNQIILKKMIERKIANSVLIKPNQIGTLSETFETIRLAHNSNYKTIISHRSGETEDCFISHLAVGVNASQIKAGSLSRTDRVAKYNELLRIEKNISIY